MSYEAAPSTVLLATHCACCNRPLRDAVSVERGVGPDCAEKFGYGNAETEASPLAVLTALAQLPRELAAAVEGDGNPHGIANRAVHHIAILAHQNAVANGAAIEALIIAIRAAGFGIMADKLTGRVEKYRAELAAAEAAAPVIRVTEADGFLRLTADRLSSDQFAALLYVLRRIPSRRFDIETRSNVIALCDRRNLWAGINVPTFHGVRVESAKGRTTIAA